MRAENIKKKRKLLQKISKRRYAEFVKYIEKVFLADYDLKILMARKFSNLYKALCPLVEEEYGGRAKQLYDKKFANGKPLIVSDRALDVLKSKIQEGKYKRVLLADDIIIHGRTLNKIYCMLQEWFEEAGITDYEIKVYAYAESREGVLDDMAFLAHKEVEKSCNTAQWRAISNDIVQVFYALGVPYTSYVPNGRVAIDSEAGRILSKALLDDKIFHRQTSVDMEINDIESYVYVAETEFPFALNATVRVYKYEEQGAYVVVPMLMLKPIESGILFKCVAEVQEALTDEYWNILQDVPESEMLYRTAIYLSSAMWGWQFMRDVLRVNPSELLYNPTEEKMNFNAPILKTGQLDFEHYLKTFSDKYQEASEVEKLVETEPDFIELDAVLQRVQKESTVKDQFHIRECLGKYLYENGRIDEERCTNHPKDFEARRRLVGYPMIKLKSLFEQCGDEWTRAVLYAIDYGKGSIVSKTLEKEGKKYFLSVIHAGEQNYKYFEETYFPFLYGLYEIECEAERREMWQKVGEWKEQYIAAYQEYWSAKGEFWLQDDLNVLKDMTVTSQFREVILKTAWDYFNEPKFGEAIRISQEILKA